ncbi:MAG: aminoacyl-tRNA hydrolase [Patescibacteria group bacterium]|nr:aminoacyl-tRNA hydrolase [Patescibacteria group bacterium]
MHYIVGLGNPGDEYKSSRHNTGRILAESFCKKEKFSEFKVDKKLKAVVSGGKMGKEKVEVILPETFMNKSGLSLKLVITSKKKAQDLIVIYDDLDLALGTFKISFNRGSGGHRGVESIVRTLKTKEFVRIRVGISPATPKGKVKKPQGEKKVVDFIIGDFKPKELEVIKKVSKNIHEALEMIVTEGYPKAMSVYN